LEWRRQRTEASGETYSETQARFHVSGLARKGGRAIHSKVARKRTRGNTSENGSINQIRLEYGKKSPDLRGGNKVERAVKPRNRLESAGTLALNGWLFHDSQMPARREKGAWTERSMRQNRSHREVNSPKGGYVRKEAGRVREENAVLKTVPRRGNWENLLSDAVWGDDKPSGSWRSEREKERERGTLTKKEHISKEARMEPQNPSKGGLKDFKKRKRAFSNWIKKRERVGELDNQDRPWLRSVIGEGGDMVCKLKEIQAEGGADWQRKKGGISHNKKRKRRSFSISKKKRATRGE